MTPESLTAQERALFDVLAAHPNRVMSRQELARRAGLSDLSPRRCDSLIVGIRRGVGADRVHTVRRRGWMLVVEFPALVDEPTVPAALRHRVTV